MTLQRVPDSAAKQALDSIRVYKEYARVRRELQQLKGSHFWKPVGQYEYLVHKVEGRLDYLGPRNAETERQFEAIRQEKQHKGQLRTRARALRASVEACQRMNKAVRAGSVPAPVVEILDRLEELGLAEKSIVLGSSALFAYSQPAGVSLDKISAPHHGSVVDDANHHLQLLVEASASAVKAARSELRSSDASLAVTPAGERDGCSYSVFEFKFKSHGKDAKRQHPVADAYWQELAKAFVSEVTPACQFEQVIIGKTGKMATMRTLDPQFFSMLSHALVEAQSAAVSAPELVQCQAALVDSLISDYLVVPKLPADECRRTVDKIAQRALLQSA